VRWFGPDAGKVLRADLDVRVGARYDIGFRTESGEEHNVGGVYREVVKNEKLQFTWAWLSTPERESLVTVLVKPDGDGSILTLIHEQFFDEPARDRHQNGWNGALNKLEKLFDVVIMSDCSQCPVHPKLKPVFHDYAKKQSDIVRKHGATPIFLMTWAYKDKPEMTAQLAEEYTIAGNANDALVIPSGLAFARAIAKRPDLELYNPDKRHPSLAGTYLSAATAYAAIYRKSPVGNKHTAGIDAETVRFLQAMAWETVQEYYGK